jgi:16S rRNA (guanine527-N7)-methyltransferase
MVLCPKEVENSLVLLGEQSGCIVSRETIQKLEFFVNHLLEWNSHTNLIGSKEAQNIWVRHVLDSAQLLPILSQKLNLKSSFIDFGCGAGFPGFVLSILGIEHMTLMDSKLKKCEFLKSVSRETKSSVEVIWGRIETLKDRKFDGVLARAVSDISTLLSLSSSVRTPEAYCIFLKGQKAKEEIKDAQKHWAFDYEFVPSLTQKEASVCILKNIRYKK